MIPLLPSLIHWLRISLCRPSSCTYGRSPHPGRPRSPTWLYAGRSGGGECWWVWLLCRGPTFDSVSQFSGHLVTHYCPVYSATDWGIPEDLPPIFQPLILRHARRDRSMRGLHSRSKSAGALMLGIREDYRFGEGGIFRIAGVCSLNCGVLITVR